MTVSGKGGDMRRIGAVIGVLLLGLLVFGMLVYAQHSYAFFYSRAAGQDLEITLLNTAAAQTAYLINAYDAWGTPLWKQSGSLAPHDAAFYLMSANVPEGDVNWGVVTVTSQERLILGLEYLLRGQLHSIDIVSQEVITPESEMSYQIGAYHTQASEAFTSLLVMNPLDQTAAGRLVVYKNDGALVYESEITLAVHESNSYNLAQFVGQGSKLWGFVEVVTEEGSVVVACKYLKEGILQVVNVAHALSLPMSAVLEPETGPPETGKEDEPAPSGKED
jgi:hypothetical protein